MQLEAGYRIVQAPRFPPIADLPARISINNGVTDDGGRFIARGDWRPISESERELLIGASPVDACPADALGLVSLSDRLRSRWWALAEAGLGSADGGTDWFPSFAAEVSEFARFKGLPLPPSCSFEVAISPPGQPSTRIDPLRVEPGAAGLGLSIAPGISPGRKRILGGFNLGDEPSALILLSLPADRLADRLDPEDRDLPVSQVVSRFFRRLPDHPLLRIELAAGEGFWFPPGGAVFDGETLGQSQVSVMLMMSSLDSTSDPT